MVSRLMALKKNKAPIMMAVLAAILALTAATGMPADARAFGLPGKSIPANAYNQQVAEPQAADPVYLPLIYFEMPAPPIPEPITVPPRDECKILSIDPPYSSSFNLGTSFKMKWVVRNISSNTWSSSEFDVRFISAFSSSTTYTTIHLGQNIYDLRNNVYPGNTYEIAIDARAPYDADEVYGERWAITEGDIPVCQFTQLIWVR